MSSSPFKGDSLDQLQTPEQVELLDAIDKLRSQGLGHYNISLPQLIVCGDQSSGKSSLLEGLTRLRFPAREGLCTTFATELVLRKQSTVEIVCSIAPGKERSPAERRELSNFSRTFSSREEFSFPSLIEEANEKMSIGTKSNRGPFFEDILRIRYSGPDVPSLTVVDLPGIISSQVGGGNGVQKVLQLVEGYMQDEKSIILAVVTANYDPEIQKIFAYIQQFDPSASRTLGIITKPDLCTNGNEKKVMDVATNIYCPLKLKWHVVKNRSPAEAELSDAERDDAERQFFEQGAWASLPRADVGIAALRTRLSRVLLEHIVKELPSLISTIQDAVTTTEANFKALGGSRDTAQQQRDFLIEKAEKFQILTHNALKGIYSNSFFSPPSSNEQAPTRLRTEIQNLNIAFAHTMYCKGHTWTIASEVQYLPKSSTVSSRAINEYDLEFEDPCHIDRSEFLQEHIADYVTHSRQSGLPSLVNPWVIGEVFRRQSENWVQIAEHHLKQVFQAVKSYIEMALSSLMDTRTRNLLMLEQIEDDLEYVFPGHKCVMTPRQHCPQSKKALTLLFMSFANRSLDSDGPV
jgi:GTPase SAR1 family protein